MHLRATHMSPARLVHSIQVDESGRGHTTKRFPSHIVPCTMPKATAIPPSLTPRLLSFHVGSGDHLDVRHFKVREQLIVLDVLGRWGITPRSELSAGDYKPRRYRV